MANDALRRIEEGGRVEPLYQRVKEAFDRPRQPQPDQETDDSPDWPARR